MMLFSLPCYIFKPIKICISVSVFTLGKQAKHHACEPAYHLGGVANDLPSVETYM